MLSNFSVVDFTWNPGFLELMLIQWQQHLEEWAKRVCVCLLFNLHSPNKCPQQEKTGISRIHNASQQRKPPRRS